MTFSPMLASSAPCTTETIDRLTGTHFFELKLDGVRGILAINQGRVVLTNRNGVNISSRYPELAVAALAKFGTDACLILDGEVAVCDNQGLPQFKLTAKRDRQSRSAVIEALSRTMPATFYAFDLLYWDGIDERSKPWSDRNRHLKQVIQDSEPSDRIRMNVGSPDGHHLLDWVREHKMEGLVAKRTDSPYQSGRRSQWIKIKPTISATFLAVGSTRGSGSRQDTFGALELAVLNSDGALVRVGEVGSGFKGKDLIEVLDMLNTGSDLLIEVEFQEFTVDGSLRFPVFKGIRTDQTRADATYSQLVPTGG